MDRRYDQVAFLTAHNAFANEEEGWKYHQQSKSILNQLRYGVRGFMLDVHYAERPESATNADLYGKSTGRDCPSGYWSCMGSCYKGCSDSFGSGWEKATSRCDCKKDVRGTDPHK
ncbi:MAG: hypothetical protein K9J74_10280, partial [Sulfuritalea sp.]|nr:hypothetical protein [Sulfuritalea sp.]